MKSLTSIIYVPVLSLIMFQVIKVEIYPKIKRLIRLIQWFSAIIIL